MNGSCIGEVIEHPEIYGLISAEDERRAKHMAIKPHGLGTNSRENAGLSILYLERENLSTQGIRNGKSCLGLAGSD
jgi:hypothetical protein